MFPRCFMCKFIHQLYLDLLDFHKPLPLIHEKMVYFDKEQSLAAFRSFVFTSHTLIYVYSTTYFFINL